MILNFIIALVTVLALIGVTTIVVFIRSYQDVKRNIKYARIRIEWASDCVTYKVLPYTSEKSLDMVLALMTTVTMREETDGGAERLGAKRLVQDKVRAVTVVHNNWSRPTGDVAGGE